MKNDLEVKIEADLTEPINDINKEIIIPPTKEISSGITKLLSVVTTFIDNATYKYIENSKYKKEQFLNSLEKNINRYLRLNLQIQILVF